MDAMNPHIRIEKNTLKMPPSSTSPGIRMERTDPADKAKVLFLRNWVVTPPGPALALLTVGVDPNGAITKVRLEGAFMMPLGDACQQGVVTLVDDSRYVGSRLRRGWRGFWRQMARLSLRLAMLA